MSALAPGQIVRVRDDWPEARGPVHIRTPHYLRGRIGTIRNILGCFPNPEDLAFARPAPRLTLYHVASTRPRSGAMPGKATRSSLKFKRILAGGSMSLSETDLPSRARGSAPRRHPRSAGGQGHRLDGRDRRAHRDHRCGKPQDRRRHRRPRLDRSGLSRAPAGERQRGGRRRWALRCAAPRPSACSRIPQPCIICRLHAVQLLSARGARLPALLVQVGQLSRPRGARPARRACEWNTTLPEGVAIRIVDSTADYRWMVLPRRPLGTEDWSADRLAAIVREGDMIGVTVPSI